MNVIWVHTAFTYKSVIYIRDDIYHRCDIYHMQSYVCTHTYVMKAEMRLSGKEGDWWDNEEEDIGGE